MSSHSHYFRFSLFVIDLDEGDIELLKTYVSLHEMLVYKPRIIEFLLSIGTRTIS